MTLADKIWLKLDKFKNLSLGVPASAFAFMKFSWVFATFQQSRMKDHRESRRGSPSWGAHWPSCLMIMEDKKWSGGSLNSGKYLLRRQTTKILGSHTLKRLFRLFLALPCFTLQRLRHTEELSGRKDACFPQLHCETILSYLTAFFPLLLTGSYALVMPYFLRQFTDLM